MKNEVLKLTRQLNLEKTSEEDLKLLLLMCVVLPVMFEVEGGAESESVLVLGPEQV